MKLRRIDLGPGPSVDDLVRRVADWDGLVCLRGEWAGGTPLLTSHPIAVLPPDAADPIAALDVQPSLDDADRDAVGGGWFGRLAFDGPSYLAFHDHVVRLIGGRWRFEALWHPDRAAALEGRLDAWRGVIAGDATPSRAWRVGEFHGAPVADHLAAVERAVELIRAGELYQVNVCTRLAADFAGSAAGLFAGTAAALDPRYGAFLSGANGIVSLSPELFLRRRGREVVSAPIKGTLPRHAGDDNAAALRQSAKDAAENVMIVDLVRNDLGRVCEIGSVRPAALLEVQPHPGVWHLVSSVAGRLRADVGDAELLRATFPPGSVTGAPKLRALEAIADLEPVGRGTYTGAIGFASPVWGAEFSVAIRTFEIADGRIALGVGGGITADSVPMLEWQECLHKARALIAAAAGRFSSAVGGLSSSTVGGSPQGPLAPLGSVGDPHASSLVPRSRDGGLFAQALIAFHSPTPEPALLHAGLLETILGLGGVPVRLADHLARLDRSSRELYRVGLPGDLADRVTQAAKAVPAGRAVLRVILRPDEEVAVSAEPVGAPPPPMSASTAVRPAGLWRHKWADRRWAAGADDVLFVGADGAVLETVRGNVFLLEPDGTLVTPPLRDDLLPGVTRRTVLDMARDEGRPTVLRSFDVAELLSRPAFWTSSLSGAVPIHLVDGIELPRADDVIGGFAAVLFGGTATLR